MEDGYLMEDGARRPSSYLVCLACRFFALRWLLVGLRCLLLGFVPSLVGRWPPCHVLQHPIYVIIMEDGYHYGGPLSHGGRGAETLVLLSLLCLAFFCFALVVVGFALLVVGFCAIISRTVASVPRPPTIKIGSLGGVVKRLFANK